MPGTFRAASTRASLRSARATRFREQLQAPASPKTAWGPRSVRPPQKLQRQSLGLARRGRDIGADRRVQLAAPPRLEYARIDVGLATDRRRIAQLGGDGLHD